MKLTYPDHFWNSVILILVDAGTAAHRRILKRVLLTRVLTLIGRYFHIQKFIENNQNNHPIQIDLCPFTLL